MTYPIILMLRLVDIEIFTLRGSLWAKYILLELKKHRGVIFYETEEGYKTRRKINLSFQNWHKKFDKFWSEHSKVSKMFTLMGSFWAKYILLGLKKYRGVIFHDIEDWYKIWRKRDQWFEKRHDNWENLHQSTWKCQNWNFDKIVLSTVENAWA